MKSRFLNLAITLGLLVGLVACTSNPVSAPVTALPTTPATSPDLPPLLTVQPMPLIVGPELVGSPTDTLPPVELPLRSESRPALLAGGGAREFERGSASWYGPGFHGRLTASGERYDMHALTAAHRTLPFGTLVRVHSLVNGREVDVRITDRGPFSRNRVIDVSRAAAQELGMLSLGFKQVVLLVPESSKTGSEAWPAPARKSRRANKHPSPSALR